jgi:hypothetical protein
MPDLSVIKALIANGEQDAAISELVRLLRSDPRNVDAWLLLADLREDPRERKDCYKQVLKLDPYNEQAQLQMRVLGGTTSLKLNVPEPRPPVPAAEPSPAPEGEPFHEAIPMPESFGAKPTPTAEGTTEAPESMLQSLRTELTDESFPETEPEANPETDETARSAAALEGLKDLPGKIKEQAVKAGPLAGRFARFTAKNRPTQVVLIILGVGLVLILSLVIWARLIPIQQQGSLVMGPAKKYIPDVTALPAGFSLLDAPANQALISLPDQGEGYRVTYTNPSFASQGRETSVTYEVLVFKDEVNAQVNLISAADPQTYAAAGRIMVTDTVAPTQLARLDTSALLYGRKDVTLDGSPAISYTLLLREVNLFARVTVTAPVADVESTQAQKLRGPLYQAVFYYASLLTGQLPLPPSSQVSVNPPVFPVIP